MKRFDKTGNSGNPLPPSQGSLAACRQLVLRYLLATADERVARLRPVANDASGPSVSHPSPTYRARTPSTPHTAINAIPSTVQRSGVWPNTAQPAAVAKAIWVYM